MPYFDALGGQTDTPPAWLATMPSLANNPAPPPPPAESTEGAASAFGSGLKSGAIGLGTNVGRLVQAGWGAVGMPSFAERAKGFSDVLAAQQDKVGNPVLDKAGMFSSLPAFSYKVGQTVPGIAGAVGAAALAPELGAGFGLARGVGAATAFMYPQAVASNMDQDPNSPGKALALGVPEAALQGMLPSRWLPGGLQKIADKALAGGNIFKHAALGAVEGAGQQALAAGATTAITQQAYTPEMSFDERAKGIVDAVLAGGAQGGLFGGLIGAASRKVTPEVKGNPADVSKDDLLAATQLPGAPPAEAPAAAAAPAAPPPAEAGGGMPAPPAPPALKVSEVESMAPEDLVARHTELNAVAEPDVAQKAQKLEVQAELARRTQPGRNLGEGTLFTPEEVAAREPQAVEFKPRIIDALDLGPIAESKLKKDPIFNGAVDEPDLINALRNKYDNAKDADGNLSPKDIPSRLMPLAEHLGMENDAETSKADAKTAREEVDKLKEDLVAAKSEKAKASIQKSIDAEEPKVAIAEQQAEWHAEAERRMKPPEEEANANQEPGAETVDSGEPSGLAAGVGSSDAERAVAGAREEAAATEPRGIASEVFGDTAPPEELNKELGIGAKEADVTSPITEAAPQEVTPPRGSSLFKTKAQYEAQEKAALAAQEQQQQLQPQTPFGTKSSAPPPAVGDVQGDVAKKFPDGPFEGKQGQVIGTSNADPRQVSLVDGLLKTMGLGKLRVLVAHPDDTTGAMGTVHGLVGDFSNAKNVGADPTKGISGLNAVEGMAGRMGTLGPDSKDFFISVKSGMTDAQTVASLSHEVGHIVDYTALRSAAPEVQKTITDAYNKWFASTKGMRMQDVIKSIRQRPEYEDAVANGRKVEDTGYKEYVTGFGEWFADGVGRWAQTEFKPRSVIEKFFAGVAQQIRTLIRAVTGDKFLPDRAVADFMNKLVQDSASGNHWEDAFAGRGIAPPVGNEIQKMQSPQEIDKSAVSAMTQNEGRVNDLMQKVADGKANLTQSARAKSWALNTLKGLVDRIGDRLPGARDYANLHQDGLSIKAGKMKANNMFQALWKAAPKEGRDLASALGVKMQNSAGLNPFKAWEDPAHASQRAATNADQLKLQHQSLVSDLSRVRQAGGADALRTMLAQGQTLRLQEIAAQLHSKLERLNAGNPPIDGHGINPDRVMQMNATLHDKPELMQAHYQKYVDDVMAGVDKRIAEVEGAATTFGKKTPEFKKVMDEGSHSDLSQLSKDVKAQLDQVKNGTYIHLDHGTGKFYAAGEMKMAGEAPGEGETDTRTVDPKARQAIVDALEKAGFKNVGIFENASDSSIFTRVKTFSQADRLAKVFREMEAQGHMMAGKTSSGDVKNVNEPKLSQSGQRFLDSHLASLRSMTENLAPAIRDQFERELRSQYLDLYPDNSLKLVLQHRQLSSGFVKDIGQAMEKRSIISTNASTRIGTSGDSANVWQSIRDQVDAAKRDPNLDASRRQLPQEAANELALREAQRAWEMPHTIIESAQAVMHSLMIGANPAYVILPMSQIPILLHAQLFKKYGAAKSALAIAKAFPQAAHVMNAMLHGQEWADGGIREMDMVDNKKISARTRDIILRADNSGNLTQTYTQGMKDQGQGAETGNKMEKFQKISNMLGLYSEMFPRIVAALSAADLHEGKHGMEGRDDYVNKTISDSQFNWGAGEASRATSNKGILGPFGKISFAFMQFQNKMVEKLYTEVGSAFKGDKEAQRFLMAHLIAVTALSGTLGLPMASAAAGAADKLAQLFTGRDDVDVAGEYRTWLKHAFGPEVGDMIAKGAPRGVFGVDTSKLGDANLLPGTSILVDKRKFEDAEKDWFKSMAGAATGELGNIWMGGRDFFRGDYLQGMIKMLPEGFKGLAEAGYLAKYGNVDKTGQKTAMQPSTADILKAAIGLDPTSVAATAEQKRTVQGIDAQRQARAQNISQHLMRGAAQGSDISGWLREAAQYTREHPGLGSPLISFGDSLKQAMTAGAIGRATGMPAGVSPLDFAARTAADYLPQ